MIIDAITNTYKQHNEDAYGHDHNFAWVIDGALPLDKTNVSPWTNDVTWVGHWWTQYLNQHLNNLTDSVPAHLEKGINQLNEAFSVFSPIEALSKLDRASFSIGITRIQDQMLECFVLGDIEIAVKFKDGHYKIITDYSLEDLDREVINMIANSKDRSDKIVFNGYTQEELDLLRRNRMRMNSDGGYHILEHEPKAIQHGIYKHLPLESVDAILLMSDGFSAIHNKYEYYSLEGLFEVVDSKGVDDIIHTLRRLELEDFHTYNRLRKHDDATGVYWKL